MSVADTNSLWFWFYSPLKSDVHCYHWRSTTSLQHPAELLVRKLPNPLSSHDSQCIARKCQQKWFEFQISILEKKKPVILKGHKPNTLACVYTLNIHQLRALWWTWLFMFSFLHFSLLCKLKGRFHSTFLWHSYSHSTWICYLFTEWTQC